MPEPGYNPNAVSSYYNPNKTTRPKLRPKGLGSRPSGTSRADRKGESAVFSAPKPTYSSNNNNDNDNKSDKRLTPASALYSATATSLAESGARLSANKETRITPMGLYNQKNMQEMKTELEDYLRGVAIEGAIEADIADMADMAVPEVYTGEVEDVTVKAGDTLTAIAKDKGVSLKELIDANPQIANPDMIRPGEKVTIPSKDTVTTPSTATEDTTTEIRTLTGTERTALSDQGGMAAASYLEDLGFTDNLFDSFEATDTLYNNTPHVPVFTAIEQTEAIRVLDNVADTIYGNDPELASAFKIIMENESGERLAELGYGNQSGTTLYNSANAPANSAKRTALQNMENSTAYINGDREKKDMMIFDIMYDDQYRGTNYKLGNTNVGDGSKYRGRGIISLTGKANYKKYGDMIGVDLVNNPDYMQNRPDIMVAASIAYLKDKGFDQGTLSARKMAKVVGHADNTTRTEARERWADVIENIENTGNQTLADNMRLNDEYTAQETVGADVDGIIGTNSITDMTQWLQQEGVTIPAGATGMDLVRLVNENK